MATFSVNALPASGPGSVPVPELGLSRADAGQVIVTGPFAETAPTRDDPVRLARMTPGPACGAPSTPAQPSTAPVIMTVWLRALGVRPGVLSARVVSVVLVSSSSCLLGS